MIWALFGQRRRLPRWVLTDGQLAGGAALLGAGEMGTLKEMKRWLRGDSRTSYGQRIGVVEHELGSEPEPGPESEPLSKVDTDDWREVAATSGVYSVSLDGGDALLQFGKNNGYCVSELAGSDEGRGYLRWMLQNEFVEEILGIVRVNLERTSMSAFGRVSR